MEKNKYFYGVKFAASTVREAHDRFWECLGKPEKGSVVLEVTIGDESWGFDTLQEFLAECDRGRRYCYDYILDNARLRIAFESNCTAVWVRHAERPLIQEIFALFEQRAPSDRLPPQDEAITVFIGHGHDRQWRDLKDHLAEQHGLRVVAYEIGPRAGLSVKEVLEGMMSAAAIAFLVLTGEDLHVDGEMHARENVIHELGLFQGRLGFRRAIAVLEEGVHEFSNILGINQIRFRRGAIRETFGDVLATIRREFSEHDD